MSDTDTPVPMTEMGGVAPFPFAQVTPDTALPSTTRGAIPASPSTGALPTAESADSGTNAESAARLLSAASPSVQWGLSDILALPEPVKAEPATKVFHAGGRDWSITVNTDASVDPDKMFALLTLIRPDQNKEPVTLQADIVKIKLHNAAYIGGLKVLEKVAISPKLSLDEWAEFGRRISALDINVMGEIINFAMIANKIGEKDLRKEQAEAGEATGAAA